MKARKALLLMIRIEAILSRIEIYSIALTLLAIDHRLLTVYQAALLLAQRPFYGQCLPVGSITA